MSHNATYFEVLQRAFSFLESHKLEPFIAEYLMLERNNWTKTDLVLHLKKIAPSTFCEQYLDDLNKIREHVPVQYLIGSCEFYSRRFIVNEKTLIPRPETEELVELVLDENTNDSKYVVDIGTGTGAIAITLQLERSNWEVMGIDISTEALKVAKINQRQLNASLTFLESDVLSQLPSDKKIDLIVSNPPYIGLNEWEQMDESVRTYEPKEALFAEHNGLAIYEKIANEAKEKLASDGRLYLEIGYLQAKEVTQLLKTAFPEKEVTVVKDMNKQDRMIKVI